FAPEEGVTGAVTAMLESIHKAMFARAQSFMRENTAEPRTYDELKQAIEAGLFSRVWWAGDAGREAAIKDETKATIRCIPLERPVHGLGRDRCRGVHVRSSRGTREARFVPTPRHVGTLLRSNSWPFAAPGGRVREIIEDRKSLLRSIPTGAGSIASVRGSRRRRRP